MIAVAPTKASLQIPGSHCSTAWTASFSCFFVRFLPKRQMSCIELTIWWSKFLPQFYEQSSVSKHSFVQSCASTPDGLLSTAFCSVRLRSESLYLSSTRQIWTTFCFLQHMSGEPMCSSKSLQSSTRCFWNYSQMFVKYDTRGRI